MRKKTKQEITSIALAGLIYLGWKAIGESKYGKMVQLVLILSTIVYLTSIFLLIC